MPVRTAIVTLVPHVVCALGVALGASAALGGIDQGEDGAREGVVRHLARLGLRSESDEVQVLGAAAGLSAALVHQPILALARRPGQGRDVYYLEARIAPDGRLLSVRRTTNLTRSPAADEDHLAVSGTHAAFATRTEAGIEALTVLDLRGEPGSVTADWSAPWKAAAAVTRWQETGRPAGIGRRRYELPRPVADLPFTLDGPRLRTPGTTLPDPTAASRGQPGLLGWSVDTVRNHPWVGPARIEALEHAFFRLSDSGRQAYYAVRGAETAAEIGEELGLPAVPAAALDAPPPEIGFPPPQTGIVLRSRMEGEGVWAPIDDEFTGSQPGLGPVFYQTWLRADPERTFARVVLTVWDPRQVALGLRAGTQEPVGDTGVAGDGMIPRDRRLLGRVVAGFNGGFQAMHGEYGVMVDDQVMLPPKPWSATVAILSGGRVGFGTWPGDLTEVPEEIYAFRQNMTVLVQDGVMDPYQRSWWGGAPPGSEDPAHTVRTAVCMTEEGFALYAWGRSISHETLGAALLAARCGYAVHLDMNTGHSGFEFYEVTPQALAQPMERRLDRAFEAEGNVRDMEDLFFRSRRMVKGMGHMRFPRYIGKDPRDFFYLTLRPILPGDPLALGREPGGDGEGVFSTAGLPHVGFPYALARTFVGARPGARADVVRIDPQRISLEPAEGSVPLANVVPGLPGGSLALVARPGPVGAQFAIEPAATATAAVVMTGTSLPDPGVSVTARAAVGVDPDGRLVWAEGDLASIAEAMRAAEVTTPMALPGPDPHFEFVSEGRTARLDGRAPTPTPPSAVVLHGVDRPIAQRLFPEVQPVHPRIWHPLQSKRVRYFRIPDAGAADAGPSPAAE